MHGIQSLRGARVYVGILSNVKSMAAGVAEDTGWAESAKLFSVPSRNMASEMPPTTPPKDRLLVGGVVARVAEMSPETSLARSSVSSTIGRRK